MFWLMTLFGAGCSSAKVTLSWTVACDGAAVETCEGLTVEVAYVKHGEDAESTVKGACADGTLDLPMVSTVKDEDEAVGAMVARLVDAAGTVVATARFDAPTGGGDAASREVAFDACAAPTAEADCDDGLDDDADGDTDCGDADCRNDAACAIAEVCDNDVDDDGDGDTDCDDPECDCATTSTPEEECDGGVDEDGDGDTDCADADCAGAPECAATCDPQLVIARVYTTGSGYDAVYNTDFVELHNRDTAAASLDGLELLVADPQTQGWARQALAGSLPGGGYQVVVLGRGPGAAVGARVTGIAGPPVDLQASNAAIALVTAGASAQPFGCPADWIDLVGIGSQPWCAEGQRWYAGGPGGADAIERVDACVDTDDNATDFTMRLGFGAVRGPGDGDTCTCD